MMTPTLAARPPAVRSTRIDATKHLTASLSLFCLVHQRRRVTGTAPEDTD